jgi:hypothetical protein
MQCQQEGKDVTALEPEFKRVEGLSLEDQLARTMIVGWGILGWDVWEARFTFLTFIGVGLILIFLFGNLAGVLFVIIAIPIPFGS